MASTKKINPYDYIALNEPAAAVQYLRSKGYKISKQSQISNALKDYASQYKEAAVYDIFKNAHPDRDVFAEMAEHQSSNKMSFDGSTLFQNATGEDERKMNCSGCSGTCGDKKLNCCGRGADGSMNADGQMQSTPYSGIAMGSMRADGANTPAVIDHKEKDHTPLILGLFGVVAILGVMYMSKH